jgi:hypothetical protein
VVIENYETTVVLCCGDQQLQLIVISFFSFDLSLGTVNESMSGIKNIN